ncbi:hypothetical protein [Glutamicibacter sp. TV12E]|uniref:hypothetical protein n=1 Tax=Glutamicibacter sp. TV12E TaxID=3446362 RepID=UPI004034D525
MTTSTINLCEAADAGSTAPQFPQTTAQTLSARALRRELRLLRQQQRREGSTAKDPELARAHEQSTLFWSGGFAPMHR